VGRRCVVGLGLGRSRSLGAVEMVSWMLDGAVNSGEDLRLWRRSVFGIVGVLRGCPF
jgi:hypothetical protein